MTMKSEDAHQPPVDTRPIAQVVFVLGMGAAAGWIYWASFQGMDWYMPSLAWIVLARFGYDRFFTDQV